MRQVSEASRPRTTWRVILHDAGAPVWNMAVDEAVFEAVEAGLAPPTLRLYRWDRAAVTVGRFQSVARTMDVDLCERRGIPIVRRPTGGRGVLHGSDQTLSIAARWSHLGHETRGVAATYRLLTRGIAEGMRAFGIALAAAPPERRLERAGDCFAVRSPADLVTEDGAKVAGAAMCRHVDAVLLQVSLLHRKPDVSPGEIFLGAPAACHYPLEDVHPGSIEEALVQGYHDALGAPMEEGELTGWELERVGVLLSQGRGRGDRVDRGMPL